MQVVGILEDGETYSTELKQRQRPGQGKMGQWEHELICQRYEKQLILQMCRLLRGFTHPGTYFEASTEELALYSVEKFAEEMDGLLDITLRSRLVEKLAMALFDCLFEDFGASGGARRLKAADREHEGDGKDNDDDDCDDMILEESDHMAVVSVHAFLQNLYFYASENNEEFRRHMLVETLLIPRLVLPYLDRCVLHATILNSRAEAYSDMLEGDRIAEMALHNPQLVKGIAASLRTLIVASFRAPATQFVMALLKRLNPTAQILRARSFCRHHEYIFALLCLLNVNMGALDLSQRSEVDADTGDSYTLYEGHHAHTLLHELATVYASMDGSIQARVQKRVMFSGALPISRDTPSYAAVMSILNGGEAGQLEYARNRRVSGGHADEKEEEEDWAEARAEAKRAARVGGQHKEEGYGGHPSEAKGSNRSMGNARTVSSGNNQCSGRDEEDSQSDDKNHSPDEDGDERESKSGYRLLGDLPSLGPSGRGQGMDYREREMIDKDVKVALNLELPSQQAGMRLGVGLSAATHSHNSHNSHSNSHSNSHNSHNYAHSSSSSGAPHRPTAPSGLSDEGIPAEFLCAINGHVMKAPVRCVGTGVVYEKATIELWLSSRGSVCPITGEALTREDLVPDDELRNRIKRYHIQQTSRRAAPTQDDDLYDF